MLDNDKRFFKQQFRHLNYYSLPTPILFILHKRLNFVMLIVSMLLTSTYTIL